MTQVLDFEALYTRLQKGHTLVTANNRLAREMTAQYARWRIAGGDGQWASPDVISWAAWMDRLWESAAMAGFTDTDRAVPGNRQLLSLWENTLKNTPLSHQLLRPEALACQLRDTRKLAIDWQLDLAHPAWCGNENYTAFRAWNRAFEQRCESNGWISPEDRAAVLVRVIQHGGLSLPANIDLLGFDEFNPSQVELLSAWIENGTTVSCLSLVSSQKRAVLLKCRDARDELRQAARWVRHCVEQNPGSSIAIVAPDLRSLRRELEWQLADILTPGGVSAGNQAKPWNISLGTPLARLPMIETVFDLFRLLETRVDIQDIGRVLRSPWLNGARQERNPRALLEKRLRDKYPRQLRLAEAEYRAREPRIHDRHQAEPPPEQHQAQAWYSPEFSSILKTLLRFKAENRGLKAASTWAESFDRLLASLGWPNADEPDNIDLEYGENWQALQAWREALRELASLDTTVARFDLQTAARQLKQICRDRIFQARTSPASIQVLGLYEVNGLRFDYLWVLGMHADTWPSAASPNPFIPGKLQVATGIPHASPQRELAVARTVTQRLLETAPDCVFSYPAKLDGEDVLPSPLLDLPGISQASAVPGWQGDAWRNVIAAADKPHVQPLTMPGKLAHRTARGGSSILENQALCPFRAFASNRLGAEALEAPADGVSPMLHGSLVHRVLEYFWRETISRAALLQLGAAELDARVRKHVDRVTFEDRGLKQRAAFRRVEADRIRRHVLAYLELEKGRGPFEAVGFEKEIHTRIEGQTIRLFIDRIDRLPSGEEIIIDYKTGRKQPKKWFGTRPEDPQLPLYAISATQPPAAVVFGIIREDGCKYEGVVTQAGLFPGLPPKESNSTRYLVEAGNRMPETIDKWRQTLHQLMADFLAGRAAIDPKNGRSTCSNSYCELQSLCRIGELEQVQKKRRGAPA